MYIAQTFFVFSQAYKLYDIGLQTDSICYNGAQTPSILSALLSGQTTLSSSINKLWSPMLSEYSLKELAASRTSSGATNDDGDLVAIHRHLTVHTWFI